MSADNWTVCPRCLRRCEKAKADAETLASKKYGKVSVEDYENLKRRATEMPSRPGETLREDYGIGVDDNGVFTVGYSCRCTECGLAFRFRHEESIDGIDVPMEETK